MESRSGNNIIYRIVECEVAEERLKHDKTFCLELFHEVLGVDVHEDDFKSLYRLGKKSPVASHEGGKDRPLLIQLREKATKNKIMESLFNLKKASDKFKNISVTHDMTQNERDDCKKLVKKAQKKQSEEQGECLW